MKLTKCFLCLQTSSLHHKYLHKKGFVHLYQWIKRENHPTILHNKWRENHPLLHNKWTKVFLIEIDTSISKYKHDIKQDYSVDRLETFGHVTICTTKGRHYAYGAFTGSYESLEIFRSHPACRDNYRISFQRWRSIGSSTPVIFLNCLVNSCTERLYPWLGLGPLKGCTSDRWRFAFCIESVSRTET